MKQRLKVAILGAGSRGFGYAEGMMRAPEKFEITAACDLSREQLDKMHTLAGLDNRVLFDNEEDFFKEKRGDALIITTYDTVHVRQCVRALKMGYDVLLEKPISDRRDELYELLNTQRETGRTVVVCHELRYGVMYEKLYELMHSGVIGKLIAIDAMERVAYWHMAQAYVRLQAGTGNTTYPTILAKCSHDMDLVQYYAGAQCDTVTSIGGETLFRKENAPKDAAERCLDCPHVDTCTYSAKKIYIEGFRKRGCPKFVWPFNKVSLKKPTTEEDLYEGLRTKCFGRCAFLCGVEENPHVVDHQLLQMNFKNGVTAVLKMVFAAEMGRRINLFGTEGELLLDERLNAIEVRPYGKEMQVIDFDSLMEGGHGHGGGDQRLIEALYDIVVDHAQSPTSLENSLECHLIGIAAEESRLAGGKLVKVHE